MEKQLNSEEEFAHKEGDSKDTKHSKDTTRMVFSVDRFLMGKMYREDKLESLTNPTKLTSFVNEVLNGQRQLWWASEKIKH